MNEYIGHESLTLSDVETSMMENFKHAYVSETYIWNEGWTKWLKWLRMHMLKIKCKCECISMDQFGKNNWVPLCLLAWTFQMHNNKQCWNLDHEQRYPNFL